MKHLFNGFYNRKRVFITGHTGFKGSWLTLWLQALGAEVRGYSDAINRNGIGDIEFHPCNVRDKIPLLSELIAFQPDVVFHLAAQPLVRASYRLPVATFETNIIGTANLLDSLKYTQYKGRALIVTSDKVYEPSELPCKEYDRLGGKDPYSISKSCAELVCNAYRNMGMDVATLRAGNVIGGGDYASDRIIPDIIKALNDNVSVVLRNPESTRPFQYVLDCLSGYLMAGCAKECPASLNFGPKDSHTVRELVDAFLSYWGSGEWIAGDKPSFVETKTLSVDSTLARQQFGWEPVLTFEESVQHTVNWYSKVATAPEQLEHYVDLATNRNAAWTKDWLSDLTP